MLPATRSMGRCSPQTRSMGRGGEGLPLLPLRDVEKALSELAPFCGPSVQRSEVRAPLVRVSSQMTTAQDLDSCTQTLLGSASLSYSTWSLDVTQQQSEP